MPTSVSEPSSAYVSESVPAPMITALVLGLYAAGIVLGAPRLLARLPSADAAPRRAVALLLVLACSLPLAVFTAGLALGLTLIAELARLDPTVDRCADQLPFNDETPLAPMLGAFGLAVAGLLVLRIAYCLCAACLTMRLRGRAHTAMLRLCGRVDRATGVTVIDHDRPACYCLPGRRGPIVLTTRAIALLTPDQFDAVVAHERAHQRGRHHLLIMLSWALRRSLPGVRLIDYTDREVRRLVELLADDAAARGHGRRTVAAALSVLGDGHVPGGALGVVAAPGALDRIARLADPDLSQDGRRAALGTLALTAAVVLPLTLATGSLAVLLRRCPPDSDSGSEPGLGAEKQEPVTFRPR
ncbi:M56 family metallopeptidase [Actinospica durhamensis]|uniref:M56 family metallopeptidase n=1 Tax=Actinospica durhamensis TaxID=1508375 RepID=A0A941EQM2_9ACTN|nr:M56 family metallopeptidase [Actinospica durhamensis]MBR7834727.1 M56 family metallopeptidase [Actinospica durhamensis]